MRLGYIANARRQEQPANHVWQYAGFERCEQDGLIELRLACALCSEEEIVVLIPGASLGVAGLRGQPKRRKVASPRCVSERGGHDVFA